jgi:hypothetical protein
MGKNATDRAVAEVDEVQQQFLVAGGLNGLVVPQAGARDGRRLQTPAECQDRSAAQRPENQPLAERSGEQLASR